MGAVACDNYQLHVRGPRCWICEMDEALVGLSSSSDEAGASKVESTVAVASAVEGVARGVTMIEHARYTFDCHMQPRPSQLTNYLFMIFI